MALGVPRQPSEHGTRVYCYSRDSAYRAFFTSSTTFTVHLGHRVLTALRDLLRLASRVPM